jgi:hypothetical protein
MAPEHNALAVVLFSSALMAISQSYGVSKEYAALFG